MHDVTCLGELLIDFTALDADASLAETRGFEKHAGGAPANVAVGVARLGGTSAFLGMVGDDEFGRFLADTLANRGVDVRGLCFTREAHTTLAFVALRADGEREFIFYRDPGADMLYGPADLHEAAVLDGRVFHHGSISFISGDNREATLRAIALARAEERLVSFDPNLRLSLWDDPDAARQAILLGLTSADILKVSEDELAFITGDLDVLEGLHTIRRRHVPVTVVTLGARGCAYAWGDYTGMVPVREERPVDTTGAGDAFMAGLLYRIARAPHGPLAMGMAEIEDALAFANRVAAHVVTRRGAIPAMPTMDDLELG